MIRIPLAKRLIASADATWLIGQFARLWCGDYLARMDELLGDTDYSDDIPLAGDYQLATWVACIDSILPDSTPAERTHLLYRSLVALFAKLKKKGEIQHE